MKALLRKLSGRRLFATGGTMPRRNSGSSDTAPAILSPGRSTTVRSGETHLEAMERLVEGEDL